MMWSVEVSLCCQTNNNIWPNMVPNNYTQHTQLSSGANNMHQSAETHRAIKPTFPPFLRFLNFPRVSEYGGWTRRDGGMNGHTQVDNVM